MFKIALLLLRSEKGYSDENIFLLVPKLYQNAAAPKLPFRKSLSPKMLVGGRRFEPRDSCAQGIGTYGTVGGNERNTGHRSSGANNITSFTRLRQIACLNCRRVSETVFVGSNQAPAINLLRKKSFGSPRKHANLRELVAYLNCRPSARPL